MGSEPPPPRPRADPIPTPRATTGGRRNDNTVATHKSNHDKPYSRASTPGHMAHGTDSTIKRGPTRPLSDRIRWRRTSYRAPPKHTYIRVESKYSPRRRRPSTYMRSRVHSLPLQIELSVSSPSPFFSSPHRAPTCSRRDAPPQSLPCHSSELGAGLSASDEKSGMNCLRVSGLTAFARHAPTSRAPPTASFVPRLSPM